MEWVDECIKRNKLVHEPGWIVTLPGYQDGYVRGATHTMMRYQTDDEDVGGSYTDKGSEDEGFGAVEKEKQEKKGKKAGPARRGWSSVKVTGDSV